VLFPAPLLSTIQELGAFLERQGKLDGDGRDKLPSALKIPGQSQ